ncbi:MAG: DUF2795 domain-containing protein [Cellvibrionaceae bacterium]
MAQQQAGNISAAELEKFIAGVKFPADKLDIIDHAKDQGAPPKILDLMNQVPDKKYESVADLSVGMSEVKH